MVKKVTQPMNDVDVFLTSGGTGGRDIVELATACDKRIRQVTQVSAPESIALAEKFMAQARRYGGEILLTAMRAGGWAYLVAGNYERARRAYLKARRLALKEPMTRARIDRVLIDVFMYLNRYGEATRHARSALTTFSRMKSSDDAAKTKVNYANVLHRQDRHRAAHKLYHEAAEHFRRKGDELALALCWYNEGNTLVQLFRFDEANTLYRDAREIFRRHDHKLHAIGCLYGLAWLHMLEGNFHIALKELSECEQFYRQGKQKRETVLCHLDRAESFLGLNLLVEARQAAEQASVAARELGIGYEQGKADFFAARAAIGMGRLGDARRLMRRAEARFRRGKHEGFAAAAQMDRGWIEAKGGTRQRQIRAARRRFSRAQLPLWEAICDLHLISEQPEEASSLRRLAHNPAVKTVPHLAARHYAIQGDRLAGRQRMREAITRWTKAAEIIDAVRAKLPPVEMRASYFGPRSDPYRKLIAAESTRDASSAAIWAERYKTVGIWSVTDSQMLANPARMKVQASLERLAGQVAAVSGMLSGTTGKRSAAVRDQSRVFAQLRGQVQSDLSELYAFRSAAEDTNSQLGQLIDELSQEQPIVQFHVGDDDLLAFVHHHGSVHVHTYPGGRATLQDLVARWRFLVECAPGTGESPRAVDLDAERDVLGRISRWLLPPLELPGGVRRLAIIPDGQLFSLPWLALQYDNGLLRDKYAICLAPSIRHFAQTDRQKIISDTARVFVGSSDGLPWLREEVAVVTRRLAGLRATVHDPCLRADFPDSASERVWHFAGHAQLRSDNPFYSALLLRDEPMFAMDFRLKQNQVDLVTLAACRTGQQTSVPGEEAGGLVRAMLEMGAKNVVAGGWAVADVSTTLWMDNFYAAYAGGSSVVGAVQSASRAVQEQYPSAYHWAAFSIYGAG